MAGRGKKLALNTITSLGLQVVNVICGFILPRLILESFGSDVNGLVNSITQFLGVITLLDLGVGAVVQSALYKPLAENDTDMISKIYVSANKFFRRLAEILLVYVVLLMIFYPMLVNKSFGHMYTALLIAAICISSFAQYYFGIVNSLLLNADQRGYIQYTAQIITLILNTIACYVVIKLGASIQIVKLTTSLIFLLRPFFLVLYVKKHYAINRKITYTEEPIKQKWNGMAQHFAAYVLSGTDNIVLTLFSSLANVSIYSVYYLAIAGVRSALLSMTNGFQSLIGEMLAKKETAKLNNFFGYVEWFLHTGTTLVFGCTGVLLVNFVRVYTNGIHDADYIQPLFAVLITIANAGHCLRLPYNILILAAGHYKQTQSNYIVAMILNIVVSIATVKIWGLVGVSIGTLVAMAYQTVWMARYDSKNIICWPFKNFLKQCGVDVITVIVASLATFKIPMLSVSYVSWFLLAIEVFAVWLVIAILINSVFYRERVLSMFRRVKGRFVK
ncbi:lipopolysaccharide biosynthesis protein [Ruminococcus sp. CAG:330]|uniref:lipopolysaccharide biosynthesis protein n=1 Tax=Ruminococcus sp. CAG:330 TaxID=1262954 RepID=UPI00033EE7AF|nr:membrane protein [Ruminococcus sp. CAG:330]CDE13471.1 putative membrane protein [Ruminococcus sp. CAG:330]